MEQNNLHQHHSKQKNLILFLVNFKFTDFIKHFRYKIMLIIKAAKFAKLAFLKLKVEEATKKCLQFII